MRQLFEYLMLKGGLWSPFSLANNQIMDNATLTTLVQEQLDQLDAFAVELNLGSDMHIKVHADLNEGHISVAQLRQITRAIKGELGEDFEDYSIEVSSPGMFTPFVVEAQYKKNIGRSVVATMLNGNEHKGKLTAYDGESVTLTWRERVPKPVGKGKVTTDMSVTLTLTDIKQLILDFKF
mgnify:CR=1 FL=1